ncbi:MAG: hypothetical protein PHR28_13915 [candidate division Zixibacteria bacterium]|jgi:hypothetical protein|nr:hypothetical protein [candidate division Zixibacteria bacterium]
MSDYEYTKFWTKTASRIKPNWDKPAHGVPFVEEAIVFDNSNDRYKWRLTLHTATHRPTTVLNGLLPDDVYKQAQYDRATERRIKQLFLNLTKTEKPSMQDTYDASDVTVYRKAKAKKSACNRKATPVAKKRASTPKKIAKTAR